ncbi:radical SAM protein [Fundidesulfovibrio terrae]|uniref:radical SAM protein n=1 Tax=Fundidesulfovibrio terrae TaxID=2922866 RepID=UPI001FAF4A66
MRYPQHTTIMNNALYPSMVANQVAEVPTFPQEIMLTTTFNCNYRCRMCFQGHYDKREMPWEMVEKLRDAFYFADTMQIIGGEPMIWSHFKAAVALANQTSTKVRITSNGALMDEAMRQFIIENQVFNIKLSADAGSAATYKYIRGGNFMRFVNNVLELSKLKLSHGVQWPILEFNFVAQKSNVGELPKLLALADSIGIYQVNVYYMNCTREDWIHESLYFHQDYADECMHKAAAAAKQIGIPINLPAPFGVRDIEETRVFASCSEPWRLLMVNMDGECQICCGGAPVMGNLNNSEFMEIWNGANLTGLRAAVNGENKPGYCRNCFGKMQKPDAIYTHFSRPLADRILAGELAPVRAAS